MDTLSKDEKYLTEDQFSLIEMWVRMEFYPSIKFDRELVWDSDEIRTYLENLLSKILDSTDGIFIYDFGDTVMLNSIRGEWIKYDRK